MPRFPEMPAARPPYREVGRPDPERLVIYLHEAGVDARAARHLPVVRALAAAGAWLVLPELPLHGTRVPAGEAYAAARDRLRVVEAVTRETVALLDALEVPRCTVVGGSLGGLCALAAAVRDPRIRRVGCFLAPYGFRRSWRWARASRLVACDPARNPGSLLDRDVLLVYGQRDAWARPPARPPGEGRFGVIVVPGQGHAHTDSIATHIGHWYTAARELSDTVSNAGGEASEETP